MVRNAEAAAMKQLHYQAQKYLDHPNAEAFRDVLRAARGDSRALAFEFDADTPGPIAAGRDGWIAMSIEEKIKYVRMHKPTPQPSSSNWMKSYNANHPELVHEDGSFDSDYEWRETDAGFGRAITLKDVGDVKDISEYYQLARNFPPAAEDWYGPREKGLPNLYKALRGTGAFGQPK
jgi:hypothetical protein